MGQESSVFNIIKGVLWYISPLMLLLGILLLMYGNYRRMEELLGREVGGIRKKIVPKIETNIYKFHEWMLEKRIVFGILFIVCAVLFYFISKS